MSWRKSTYSNPDNCVEAGQEPVGIVVRDTTDNGNGVVLHFSPATWERFLSSRHFARQRQTVP